MKAAVSFFILPQRKNNIQRAVLVGTAVCSIGTTRWKPLVPRKSKIMVVFFCLAGYLMKLTTTQEVNYSRNLTSNMVL